MADVSTPAELKAALDLLNVDIEYSNDIDLDGYGSKFQFFRLNDEVYIGGIYVGSDITGQSGASGTVWAITDTYNITVKLADAEMPFEGGEAIEEDPVETTVVFSTAPYDGSVVTSWIPAGQTATASNDFVASIDGKGFKTSNMAVFMPARIGQGLIAEFHSSTDTIKNMWMEDCDVKCDRTGGWIVGFQVQATIEKCVVSNCTLTSYSTEHASSGGVVGWLYSGTVRDCYAYNCTVVGESTGISDVVGRCRTTGVVTNCHSVGSTLSGGSYTRPCVGDRAGTITNCYYDKTKYGSTADGDGVTGLTSEEMKQVSSFIYDASSNDAYSSDTEYSKGDIVKVETKGYMSLIDANTGNYPPDSPTQWQKLVWGFPTAVWTLVDADDNLLDYPHLFWEYDQDIEGSGTAADPYKLGCCIDFINFANTEAMWASGKYTVLIANILLGHVLFSEPPLGKNTDGDTQTFTGTAFSGHFVGAGFYIKDFTLSMDSTYRYYGGLVGINEGYVLGINLVDVDVDSDSGNHKYHGTVVGCNNGGVVQGCRASGAINLGSHSDRFGGFVGINLVDGTARGLIEHCYSTVTVTGGSNSIGLGGFIGENQADVKQCLNRGDIDSDHSFGGFVGRNYASGAIIERCQAICDINGCYHVCGFASQNVDGAIIRYCLYKGTMTSDEGLSNGLYGFIRDNAGTIQQCAVEATLESDDGTIAGFCRENSGTIEDSIAVCTLDALNGTFGFVQKNSLGVCIRCVAACYHRINYDSNLAGVLGQMKGFCAYNGTENNCFYDKSIEFYNAPWDGSQYDEADYELPNDGTNVTGKTTAELFAQSTYTNYDFNYDDQNRPVWVDWFDGYKRPYEVRTTQECGFVGIPKFLTQINFLTARKEANNGTSNSVQI
jgi:hypothetical protein